MTAIVSKQVYGDSFKNVSSKLQFVAMWSAQTDEITFDYSLPKRKMQVASTSSNEVYTVTQHPHSHSCTCKGAQRWTRQWHDQAFEAAEQPKVCKHVQGLIDAGVMTAPPIKREIGYTVTYVFETDTVADLQIIDGQMCVPVSKTNGKVVPVTAVLAGSALVFAKA